MLTDKPEKVRAILAKLLADDNLTNDEQEVIQRHSLLKDEFIAVLAQIRRFEITGPESLNEAIGLTLNQVIDKAPIYEMDALRWMGCLLQTNGQRCLFLLECVKRYSNRFEFRSSEELLQEISRIDLGTGSAPFVRGSIYYDCAAQSINAGYFDLMIDFLKRIEDNAQKSHAVKRLALVIWTLQAQFSYHRSQQKPFVEQFFRALRAWHPQEFQRLDEVENWIHDKVYAIR